MAALQEADLSISSLRAHGKGWNALLALDANEVPKFACNACHNICKDAVELSCDHIDDELDLFCNDCLLEVLDGNNQICPINPSHKETSGQSSRYARKQILKLKVHCPYSANMNRPNIKMICDTIDEKEGSHHINNNSANTCIWKGTLNDLITNHIKTCQLSTNDIIKEKLYEMELKLLSLQHTVQNNQKAMNEALSAKEVEIIALHQKIGNLEKKHNSELDKIKKVLNSLTKTEQKEESKENEFHSAISVHGKDEWDLQCIGKNMTLQGNTLTINSTTGNSAYCAKHISSGIHEWTFKIEQCGNASGVVWSWSIGIFKIENECRPQTESYFAKGAHKGYGYAVDVAKLLNISTGGVVGGANYGVKCKSGDMVKMRVDLEKLALSYSVNGKDQGIAYQNIDRAKYRVAIDLYNANDSITLMDYAHI